MKPGTWERREIERVVLGLDGLYTALARLRVSGTDEDQLHVGTALDDIHNATVSLRAALRAG